VSLKPRSRNKNSYSGFNSKGEVSRANQTATMYVAMLSRHWHWYPSNPDWLAYMHILWGMCCPLELAKNLPAFTYPYWALHPVSLTPSRLPPILANRRRDFIHGFTELDTKLSFSQSQPCQMTSRPMNKGSPASHVTRRQGSRSQGLRSRVERSRQRQKHWASEFHFPFISRWRGEYNFQSNQGLRPVRFAALKAMVQKQNLVGGWQKSLH
jgi:hypothetical protein